MLISALNDYYGYLAKEGKVLPAGYSFELIDYIIALDEDGKIGDMIDLREKKIIPQKNGKVKTILKPKKVIMPKRTEKPGIESNIIEHRSQYIFGLNFADGILTTEDRTGKARKSHEAFVLANLKFIEDIDSPSVNAYRNFINKWKPEEETENPYLIQLGKGFNNFKFAFCLNGYPDELLHDDEKVKAKWESKMAETADQGARVGQCAVSGETAEIARLHDKIKGVLGGNTTGTVLIGFNSESDESYGNRQGDNSNVSKTVMEHYTEALNYLLSDENHRVFISGMTIVFFAMKEKSDCEDKFSAYLLGNPKGEDEAKTEDMLRSIWGSGKSAAVNRQGLNKLDEIDPNVDFYMFGLRPNASRLSLKFIYRRKFADILYNIAEFQRNMQVTEKIRVVSIYSIRQELVSPKISPEKARMEKASAMLIVKLLESVVLGYPYPSALLETMIRRVKTDRDSELKLKRVRVREGVIKACLNRNYVKEEFGVALDHENKNQAYLCGRLFAVLEKLQNEASGGNLNRTIKDSYFASACSKPAMVFPVLIKLAQNHLNKAQYPVFYNKIIGEIMEGLNDEFPETLLLDDQGRFIIGYYQQQDSFYQKKEKAEAKKEKEDK